MKIKPHTITQFLHSQSFIDGLRITAAILLPALIFFAYDQPSLGFTFALGASCVSLTDAPGPIAHRKNGMLVGIAFNFLVAAFTLLVNSNIYLLGLEVFLLSFFFSMFNIYGTRAGAIGSAALLIMILNMDTNVERPQIGTYSLMIAGGGLWYMAISMLAYYIRPYRPAQRALGICITEIATFLSIKADFYNTATDLNANYQKLITQQIQVNEQLELVREHFYKTRHILKSNTSQARRLLYAFDEAVDLFEDITAIYYDYTTLREQFKDSGVLDAFSVVIKNLSNELERIGRSIQLNAPYTMSMDFDAQMVALRNRIDEIVKPEGKEHTLVLKRILVNVRRIMQRIREISKYFDPAGVTTKKGIDYSRFVSHHPIDKRLFWDNLNKDSLIFKHSLRVAIACIAGFIIAKSLSYGEHAYWILLTIAFIIKPAFSLTRQRNVERIIGTVFGAFTGVFVLFIIRNATVQFVFMVLFMLGAYSFLRTNYKLMVYFTTTYVILLFKFLGFAFLPVMQERVLDTIIGCAVAFSASYFLFPVWESEQLRNYMKEVLQANANYLQKLLEGLLKHPISSIDYKLARKEVYIHSANLSAAIQRMASEPRNKQKHLKNLQQFALLNHILFSNVATLASSVLNQPELHYGAETITEAQKALRSLYESISKLEKNIQGPNLPLMAAANEMSQWHEDPLFTAQLQYLHKITSDIDKTTDAILST
jgi:uncharacterized membrane protein (TIGR01666 family)